MSGISNIFSKRAIRNLTVSVCLTALSACSVGPIRESHELWDQGRIEEAVTTLHDAWRRDPQNHRLQTAYEHERELALSHFTIAADRARGANDIEQARRLYEAALRLNPDYARAREGLAQLDALTREDRLIEQARQSFESGDLRTAQARLDRVLAQDSANPQARRLQRQLRDKQALAQPAEPVLKSTLDKPITLDLRDTPLRNVFDALSQTAGLNFVFDRDVRTDSKITIFIRNNRLEDVLHLVLATNALESKVLNGNTVLIYPNNAAKTREYQDLVVRTFYLTNIEAKEVQTLLKSMAHTKDIYIDEKLNLVTIRDTPEAVRLAEKLVESVDVAEGEVMLEVEVMELSRTRAEQLGLQFPTQAQRGIGLAGTAAGATSTASSLIPTRLLGQTITTITNPVLVADLSAQDQDANLLANPRIRVKNREKAKVLIGEKLPVITSTAIQNAGVSTSVSYLDVGLKLEVEPQIYLDDEVGIKVNLEVNSNLGAITQNGTTAYNVGTRSATTVLRLHDGETQVLAGLINDNERATLSKLPGLGDLPGIGRIFTDTNSNHEKTEIVLLITPRILRNVVVPDFDTLAMPAGTEAQPGAAPLLIGATDLRSLAVGGSGQAPAPRGGRPAARAHADMPGETGALAGATPGGAAASNGAAGASAAAAAGAGFGSAAGGAGPGSGAVGAGAGSGFGAAGAAAVAQPVNVSVTLKAPSQAALGSMFTVSVELQDAGNAVEGEVTLGFDPSLLQAPGPASGRAVVHLAQVAPGLLSGSVAFKAQAAGAGSASIAVAEGHLRMPDNTQVPLSGGSVTVNIGL